MRVDALTRPRTPVLILAATGAVLAGSGFSFGWLLVTAMGTAAWLAGQGLDDRRRSVLSCLPAAAVLIAVLALGLSLLAGYAGLDLMADQLTARAVLEVISASLALAACGWPGSPIVVARWGELVAVSPVAWTVLWGVRLVRSGVHAQTSWLFHGGDNLNHVLLASGVQRAGHLSYHPGQGYPRLLHNLVALLASSTQTRGRGLATLLHVADSLARLEWFGWGLAMLATSLLTYSLVRRVSEPCAAVAGAGAGAQLLGVHYFSFGFAYGFATSTLLVLLLAVWAVELLERRSGSASAVLMTGVLFVAVSHTWQLALVPLAVGWALTLVLWWRDRSSVPWVVAGVAACGAASLPALLFLVTQVGVGQVAIHGGVGVLAHRNVVLALLASVVLVLLLAVAVATRRTGLRSALRWALVVQSVPLLALSAGALAAAAHTPIASYYPVKLLWNASALGMALVWACLGLAAAGLSVALARWLRAAQWLPVLAGAAALLLVSLPGLLSPMRAAGSSHWGDSGPVIRALSNPDVARADSALGVTTPKRSVVSDHNAEVLLQFWHLDGDRFPPPPTTQLALRTPEARCTALRGRQRTLLLSARTTPQLLRLVGCPNVLRARLVVIPFDPGTPIEQLLSKL